MNRIPLIKKYIHTEESLGAKILAFMAAFCLLMQEYYIKGTNVNLHYVAMFLVLFFVPKRNVRKLFLRKAFFRMGLFYIFLCMLSFLFYGREQWYSNSAINNIVFVIPVTFIILYLYTDSFNIRIFLRWTIIMALLSSVIIVYQRISFILTGDYYDHFFLSLPWLDFYRDMDLYYKIRPTAFFSEPAHYVEFCLPVLIFLLLKKYYLIAFIITLGVIVSGSTTGLVESFFIFFSVFFLERRGPFNNSKKLLAIIVILFLFIFGYYILNLYFPEIIAFQRHKAQNTDVENYARLLGPLPILLNFDFLEWMIGIGIGNKNSYIVSNHLSVAGGTTDYFTNTFFSLLVFFGICGFAVFVIFMIRMYVRCCKGSNISYFLVMITLVFSTNMIFEAQLLYYVFFVANTRYIEKNDNIFSYKSCR